MGPSPAGEIWGGADSAHKVFSCPIRLLPKRQHLWSWFPPPSTTSKALVHREQVGPQTLLVPMASNGLGLESRKCCFPEETRIGAELGFPLRVSLSRMQLPETSLVPFLRWAIGGSLHSWRKLGWCGQCTQGLFRPHAPSPQTTAPLGWFPAPESTSKAPVHREQAAAQTLLFPMASRDLGEKLEIAVY